MAEKGLSGLTNLIKTTMEKKRLLRAAIGAYGLGSATSTVKQEDVIVVDPKDESYTKNKIASVTGMAALCGALPGVAKARRKMTRIIKNEPPRTMTDEEKAYYAIHKTLNGFK
jgi:hypothetical protein